MNDKKLQSRLNFFWPGYKESSRVSVGGVDLILGCGRRDGACGEGIFIYCIDDKRPVLDGYMLMHANTGRRDQLEGEIRRLANMDLEGWESFLKQRPCYNPFLDRRNRQRVKAGDRGLRHMWKQEQFTDSEDLTAVQKMRLAHDYEKLITACVFGGRAHAISRLPDRLSPLLAKLYAPTKFTKAELRRALVGSLQEHLQLVMNGKTAGGENWEIAPDLKKVFVEVAKTYVYLIKKSR